MYLIRVVLVAIVTVLGAGAFLVDTAEACKPMPPDIVSAPTNEKSYDASLSPASPSLLHAALISGESVAVVRTTVEIWIGYELMYKCPPTRR